MWWFGTSNIDFKPTRAPPFVLSTPKVVENLSICYFSGGILWKVMDWSNVIFRGLLNVIITKY